VQKSKLSPFPKKPELFTKRYQNDPQSDPEKHKKTTKNSRRRISGNALEKNTKKTMKINLI